MKNVSLKIKAFTFFIGYFFVFILCQQNFYNSRIPASMPEYEKPSENTSPLHKWGYNTYYASTKHQFENPEIRTDFHPNQGIVGNIIIAIKYPWNLLQGAIEASAFWITLLLGMLLEKAIKFIFKKKLKITIFIVVPVLLLHFISTVYLDHKYFDIPIERGFYYPLWIILFVPVWQAIKTNWYRKKVNPVSETTE